MFTPTFVDIGIFIGTIGFFFVLFLLYARTFPVIAQAEVKTILKSSGAKYKALREAGKVMNGSDKRTSSGYKDFNVMARTPVANSSVSEGRGGFGDSNFEHEPTVNADALIDSEVKKDQIDQMLVRIGRFNPSNQSADDLQKISKVGPVMEQNLHQMGIYTYNQISKMTKKDYDLLDDIIPAFAGRAERDDWADQATKLKK